MKVYVDPEPTCSFSDPRYHATSSPSTPERAGGSRMLDTPAIDVGDDSPFDNFYTNDEEPGFPHPSLQTSSLPIRVPRPPSFLRP